MENLREVLLAIPKNAIIRITDNDNESEDTLFFGLNALDSEGCLIEGKDMENGFNSVQLILFADDSELIKDIEIIKVLNDKELDCELLKLKELYCIMVGEDNEDTRSEQETGFRSVDSSELEQTKGTSE